MTTAHQKEKPKYKTTMKCNHTQTSKRQQEETIDE